MAPDSKELVEDPIKYWVQIQRGLAFLIDCTFVALPFILLSYNTEYEGFLYYLYFPLLVIYYTYFEYKYGKTVGKKLLGIKVLMESGDSLTLRASIIRNILRIFESLLFGGWVSFALLYATPKKQRIGDILAHTVVVRTY